MNKTTAKIILVIVVLALLWIAYRFFFNKPEDGFACSTNNDSVLDGIFTDGVCVKVDPGSTDPGYAGPTIGNVGDGGNVGLNPTLNSVFVSKESVAIAQDPSTFFNNIDQTNFTSYNVLTSALSNPTYIHFNTNFDGQCPRFVWYKNWLYSFRSEKIVETSAGSRGATVKACYYGVDKNVLPEKVKIRIPHPASQCPSFKVFISGIEYKYSQTVSENVSGIPVPKTSCVYDKQ